MLAGQALGSSSQVGTQGGHVEVGADKAEAVGLRDGGGESGAGEAAHLGSHIYEMMKKEERGGDLLTGAFMMRGLLVQGREAWRDMVKTKEYVVVGEDEDVDGADVGLGRRESMSCCNPEDKKVVAVNS